MVACVPAEGTWRGGSVVVVYKRVLAVAGKEVKLRAEMSDLRKMTKHNCNISNAVCVNDLHYLFQTLCREILTARRTSSRHKIYPVTTY